MGEIPSPTDAEIQLTRLGFPDRNSELAEHDGIIPATTFRCGFNREITTTYCYRMLLFVTLSSIPCLGSSVRRSRVNAAKRKLKSHRRVNRDDLPAQTYETVDPPTDRLDVAAKWHQTRVARQGLHC